jgi:hypothetical protein
MTQEESESRPGVAFYRRGRLEVGACAGILDGGGAWVELFLESGKFC